MPQDAAECTHRAPSQPLWQHEGVAVAVAVAPSGDPKAAAAAAAAAAALPLPQGQGRPKQSDIQVLRALALSLVFLFHLGLPLFAGGFVGVDIFFVVSGYLVFGSVLRELGEGRFAFGDFACRRAKRLSLPSATLLAALLALLMLSPGCARGACRQAFEDIGAASLHWANMHFLQGSVAYFTREAESSAVMHFWSLAVEEQLYIALPAALWLWRRLLPQGAGSRSLAVPVLALSALSLWLVFVQQPAYKFFFPASRVWEFAAGALVSWYARPAGPRLQGPLYALYVLCWATLLVAGMVVSNASYPNYKTLVVVGATAFILWCKAQLSCVPLERLGDMSYSIYLYHWPVILFLKQSYSEASLVATFPFTLAALSDAKGCFVVLVFSAVW
eukprot:m51a1_g8571 hypothetical protein (388) ;mRNA; f:195951-199864